MEKHLDVLPWYRQFWPWFIISLPMTAVIASITTYFIAAHNPDGLVADDYYKQGLAINQTLDLERHAQSLGLTALLRVDADTHHISLTLDGQTDISSPMVLRMIHPTRPNLDRTLSLSRDDHGTWSAALDKTAAGRWQLQLEPSTHEWRLSGRLSLPQQQQTLLQPNTN